MTAPALRQDLHDPARVLVELRGFDLDTASGRPLIRDLSASISAGDRVALIGRNGVGKSSLLGLIAGPGTPTRGRLIRRGRSVLVPQELSPDLVLKRASLADSPGFVEACSRAGLAPLTELFAGSGFSRGELRKLALCEALAREPDLLLLDEPTQDLDAQGLAWLCERLARWPHALLVASHSPRLLGAFEHFFVLAESGCRYLPGRFEAVRATLERDARRRQQRYVEGLARLDQDERHHRQIRQRRARKKNLGRIHELGRGTPRSRLNKRRSYAQESQARVAKIRADRIARSRGWTRALRRALRIELPLDALVAELPPDSGEVLIEAEGLSLAREGRVLFEALDLEIGRERVALVGPNGSGKTTLVEVLLGEVEPDAGRVHTRADERIGLISQGGANWRDDRSLLEHLVEDDPTKLGHAAALLVAHRFPLALAERPLAELSPGERVRAALICLYRRRPPLELLILDEPTISLDFVGLDALTQALAAWPGGLVVASHDQDFLAAVGFDRRLSLGR